jgi:hypothetical protein
MDIEDEIFIKINCPCFTEEKTVNLNYYNGKPLIKCPNCNKYQHKLCLEKCLNIIPYYICPDCQIENLDLFIEQKKKIIRKLFHGKDFSNSNIVKCHFDISTIIPFNINYAKEDEYILFRCLKIDDEGFNTLWPGFFDIYINKIMIQNPLNEEKELSREIAFRVSDKFKRKTNLKISSNLKHFSKINKNELLLNFNAKCNKKDDFILAIDYVKEKKLEEVIENIPSKYENKKELDNIVIEKVSLLDIYTDTDVITIPAKGWKCTHLSCFNLKTFLGFMEHTRLYKCPFCKQKVGLIFICNEMKDIIQKYYSKENYEIILDSNYNVIEKKKEEINNIGLGNLNNLDGNKGDNINNSINDNSFSNKENINQLDFIIDEIILKNFKKKKDRKFEISIKTD